MNVCFIGIFCINYVIIKMIVYTEYRFKFKDDIIVLGREFYETYT